MAAINVRRVPAELHAVLVQEARASHRSLTAVVLVALSEYAERIRRHERLGKVRIEMDALREGIRRRQGSTRDSARLIAQDRRR